MKNWFKKFSHELVVLAVVIIATMILWIIVSAVYHYKGYVSHRDTKVYECVKTYVLEDKKRVNLRTSKNSTIITMECNNLSLIGVTNSSELFAQFEPNHWYVVQSVGYCDEKMQVYPTIIVVTKNDGHLTEKDTH